VILLLPFSRSQTESKCYLHIEIWALRAMLGLTECAIDIKGEYSSLSTALKEQHEYKQAYTGSRVLLEEQRHIWNFGLSVLKPDSTWRALNEFGDSR